MTFIVTCVEWMCASTARLIFTTVICFLLFAGAQALLCLCTTKKTLRMLPLLPVGLCTLTDLLLAVGVFGSESSGLPHVHILLAGLLLLPIAGMRLGMLGGWGGVRLLKRMA